nr:MAG TPA: hypothetical protein [Caudoviricetes sp.]
MKFVRAKNTAKAEPYHTKNIKIFMFYLLTYKYIYDTMYP